MTEFINLIKKGWKNFKSIIITIVIVFITFNFIILNGYIPSSSMETTVMTGDSIVAFRMSYMFNTPQRGDIIVFNGKQTKNEDYIKRVIAIAGDTVDLIDGDVYVNNVKIDETSYIKAKAKTYIGNNQYSHFEVPSDKILVFGDNRENSADSRYMEDPYISCKDVKGEVFLRYSLFRNGFFFKLL